ncbi:MAG: NAD(P)-dependent alcohol dehydrogenase [Nostoc sp.]|uniref:zinc-dependent alcohol dehydrogenase family protein n=1 Tax=Nostoc sp. TaxID=1180 RepID=UPI002FF7BFB5
MQVIELQKFGIKNLQLTEKPKPSPAPEQVLVKMEAVSLNSVDLLTIEGKLNPKMALPYVPVADGAGVVEQVGDRVTELKPGDRVVSLFVAEWRSDRPTPNATDDAKRPGLGTVPGELTQYKVFQAHQLIKVPANLSAAEAATLSVAALTAWNGLKYSKLQAGETALLHGTGGVSIFALQFAKARGANVIITSSSDDKLARSQQLGADFVINYKTTPEWEPVVHQMTEGRGADVVVETVGGKNLQKSLNALRMGGHISIMGLMGGFETTINALVLLKQQATIRGMEVGSTEDFAEMNQAIAAHDIHPVIDKTFPLDQIQQAFEYLKQGRHFGKVVVTL